MKRYIRCINLKLDPKKTPLTRLVKDLGNEMYKKLYGRDKRQSSSDTFDVWTTLLYHLKEELGGDPNEVEEMTININLTTYSNKIRVNTIEVSPDERTLGCDIFIPASYPDITSLSNAIYKKISQRIRNAYEDYIILF